MSAQRPHKESMTDAEAARVALKESGSVDNAALDGVLRRLAVGGRVVRLGWFRAIDPHLVSLTSSDGRGRLDLLLMPPASEPEMVARNVARVLEQEYRAGASATLADVTASLASSRTDGAAEGSRGGRRWTRTFEPHPTR